MVGWVEFGLCYFGSLFFILFYRFLSYNLGLGFLFWVLLFGVSVLDYSLQSLVGLGKVRRTGAKRSGPESVLAPNISPQTPTRERPQFLSLCPFFKPTSSLLLLHLTLSSLLDPSAVMITVSVKWQKEIFKEVEIDTTQSPYVFKCQLYDLTGVPPERQKIMVKGGLLKDDADWSTLGVKEGQKLMMMGTADEIVKSPEKGTVFVEDLPEEEQVVAVGHTAGLFNLGNTCYMNSTLQCLHSVPELKSSLIKYSHSGRNNDVDPSSHMLTIATRDLFNELDKSVKPVAPMQFWMVLRKKYPQFGQLHNGVFMQQDAEECWTQLLYTLSQSLRSPGSSENLDAVKAIFGIELISRYLTVQFVRFFWKRESNQKAKILRKVDYPLELDVYDFCSDDLRKKLDAPRQILRNEEGKKLGLKVNDTSSAQKENDVKMADAEGSSNVDGEPSVVPMDEGKNLQRSATHLFSAARHYVGWVKQENGKWIEFDDDNPKPRVEDDITRLSGGGDWHMAYIIMYKARVVSV
ncbi:Ubiquitin carboxyl-terminal hydrolase [Vigna angularis]|uniref:ubiquitinyl hydrolase 1 n=1 Tax=Phaseolus angularis TaxID=3914 RepID=A0A8T0JSI7_PHAAN|nr:Ubiquitin carboxyl-terminal hydrolase [Vigna angularis]